MPLPINIEDLLNKRRVESNRIEFKKGWNPTKIYRSICAFANDFDNIGGGYILVGVEEQEGIAVRPVKGIPTRELDFIQQKMVEFNNKIEPYYNYPYQALEEAVVNALYHRDYQEREPVEITIEPHQISILSYAGPDRSISFEAIRECRVLRSRRYRNRRLGDFLKELDLTEGRSTGIPTIQKVLKDNGSPKACIETDENRSYFLIDIPCREGFNLPNFTNETSKDPEESFAELLSQIAQVLYKSLDKNNVMSINNLEKIVAQLVTDLSESRVTSLSQVKRMSMKEIISLWIKTLSCATSEKTLKEIMSFCAQTNRYRFIKTAIHPLIDLGWLKMTIPDKPNSSKQKYVISLRGKQYVS